MEGDRRSHEDKFGVDYVIRQMADRVESIHNKLDAFATKAEVAFLSSRIDDMPTAGEHKMHWDHEEERFNDFKREVDRRFEAQSTELGKVAVDIADLKATRMPRGTLMAFLTLLAIIVTITLAIVQHFVK